MIGSAAPDVGQDAMWYHLTLPRAWIQRGNMAPFPTILPSNYALGIESLYAALLLFSDEVSCSLLYAQIVLAALLAIPAAASRLYGRSVGWVAAALALTLFASSTLMIPLGAWNDFGAMLFMLLSLSVLLAPREALRVPSTASVDWKAGAPVDWRAGALAGLLAGAAFSVKILAAGFILPCFIWILAGNLWRVARKRDGSGEGRIPLSFFVAFILAAAALYGPWAVRGLAQGCGNPLFPFGEQWLPHREAYQAMVDAFAKLHTLASPTPSGMMQALGALPRRLYEFSNAPDIAGPFLLAIGLIGSVFARGLERRLCVALLLQFAVWCLIGGNEVMRFFMLCYPLAMVAGAGLFTLAWNRRPELRRVLAFALLAIVAMGASTWIQKQGRYLTGRSLTWPGRPYLTESSRALYAGGKGSGGPLYVPFTTLSRLLPREARVLLPDCVYPFYLGRFAVWSCEVSPPILSVVWAGLDARQAAEWMARNGITHVILLNEPADPRLLELRKRGVLIPFSWGHSAEKSGGIQVYEFHGES